METWDILRYIWFILIGVLFVGYSVLDGFDLGMGPLFPFLARSDEDKKILINSIGPFWDGNEVWLLTGGGALFAAFPQVYATVFSGFYLALMLVLFALIFRAVSLEFRRYDPKRKKLWEYAFIFGSFLPSLLFGVALGNVIRGIPLDQNMNFTGNFFTLLNPFALTTGLLGMTTILLQGTTYAALKSSGMVQQRAFKISKLLWILLAVLFLISLVATWVYLPEAINKIIPWIFTAIVITAFFFLRKALSMAKEKLAFLMSSIIITGLWGIAGSIHFPNLVKASNDPAMDMTIYNSSSSELTLKVMLVIALIGMPLVIGYTIYLYKIFKGKVKEDEYSY